MNFSAMMITYYTNEQVILLTLASLVVAALLGAIADRIMGSAGFGMFGNACLVALAIAVAVAIDSRDLARLMPEETVRIGLIAASVATGLLLTLGSLRSWFNSQLG
jgi:uncharacterized membrane protein YeaQ/YmgE (transglycosylase-associated protein family)